MSMIDVAKAITADEIALMNKYVEAYGKERKSLAEDRVSFDKLLEKCWAYAKADFYRAFGEKLILTKSFSYCANRSALEKKISACLFSRIDSAMYKFRKAVQQRAMDPSLPDFYIGDNRYSNVFAAMWIYLLDDAAMLADNVYSRCDTIAFPTPNGKELKISSGAKLVKFIGKLAKAYDVPGYEEFRIEHSQIVNAAHIEGELCLSIHPLDFITLSENESDWTSCMNWHERGCYRRGTVEMMNSASVVVAYIKSKGDMAPFPGFTWNNKKWRQLFVVTPEIIAGIKSYPYYSMEISGEAEKWIAEIMNAAGYKYNIGTLNHLEYDDCDNCFYDPNGDKSKEVNYRFETTAMYNDFGCATNHAVILNEIYAKDRSYREYNYSGAAQCVWCGEFLPELIYNYDDDTWSLSPEILVCHDCGAPDTRCNECGVNYDADEMIRVDDLYICPHCAERYVEHDCLTGEPHMRYRMRNIYLSEDRIHALYTTEESQRSPEWSAKLPPVKTSSYGYWCTYYIFDMENATETQYANVKDLFEKRYGMSLEEMIAQSNETIPSPFGF